MRLYNGCPDSQLQAKLNNIAEMTKQLKVLNPNAHITFHYPTTHRGGWIVHEWGDAISGFFPIKELALQDAIKKLKKVLTP